MARAFGAEVIQRPIEISTDTASSESCLVHALDYLKAKENLEPDLVVFLQATSPLRETDEIQKAIETLEREQADSLFSACRVEGFTWRLRGDSVAPVNYDPAHRPLRQELQEEVWEENGSIYIFKPWVLRKSNNRLGGKIVLHQMSALDSFQIDDPADLDLVEHLMAFRKAEQKPESRKRIAIVSNPVVGGSPSAVSQLSRVKLLVLDFDGVLTDNHVLVQEDGTESVYCDRSDGLGVGMLKAAGVEVIVISKEKNPVVAVRCRKLGVECIQGCDHKLAALRQRSEDRGLKPVEIGYVGNDVNDLECLRWVGLPIAVCDAAPEVLEVARWVTAKCGGRGAVREICDAILAARRETLT